MIADPLFAGAVHDTVALALPGTADGFVGADGTEAAAAVVSPVTTNKATSAMSTTSLCAEPRLRRIESDRLESDRRIG